MNIAVDPVFLRQVEDWCVTRVAPAVATEFRSFLTGAPQEQPLHAGIDELLDAIVEAAERSGLSKRQIVLLTRTREPGPGEKKGDELHINTLLYMGKRDAIGRHAWNPMVDTIRRLQLALLSGKPLPPPTRKRRKSPNG